MTLSSLETSRTTAASVTLPALLRALAGLLVVSIRNPGRPLCISRRTGRVTPR